MDTPTNTGMASHPTALQQLVDALVGRGIAVTLEDLTVAARSAKVLVYPPLVPAFFNVDGDDVEAFISLDEAIYCQRCDSYQPVLGDICCRDCTSKMVPCEGCRVADDDDLVYTESDSESGSSSGSSASKKRKREDEPQGGSEAKKAKTAADKK